jgi:VanZ family protein
MNKAAQSLHFAVLFWVVGILGVMSLGLAPHFPSLPAGGDKILHASAFLALMIWPVLLLPRMGMIAFSAFFLLFCGTLLEVLQGFVPGRESSGADLFADVIGICAGLLLGYCIRKIEPLILLPAKDRAVR